MSKKWILFEKETRRTFSKSTWIPLRASCENKTGNLDQLGFTCDGFFCGSVAFPPEHREQAESLSWTEIGIGHSVEPCAYDDGCYKTIDQFQHHEKHPIGVELVFEHPQPVVGGTKWILNPDLVVALRLIKEGRAWLRPEEDFAVVARECFQEDGSHRLIEIKQEYLLDYLAARGLSLRISSYFQRAENVESIENTEYSNLGSFREERDGGSFELHIMSFNKLLGGTWGAIRSWRTDIDEEDDAPLLGPESNENTDFERTEGTVSGYSGVRIEGEFWRDEWIEHQNKSIRVRRDKNYDLPRFIIETNGEKVESDDLYSKDVGRWLWFRSTIISTLLGHRGFSFRWYTAETGGLCSTSSYATHFGLNSADLVTVYAYDIARLGAWEQHVWAAHNVAPDGKVSKELFEAQVKVNPASTLAAEVKLFTVMRILEKFFQEKHGIALFSHDIDDQIVMQKVSRFMVTDRASLLRLAKEVIRVFSDRINIHSLRDFLGISNEEQLRSNKLLQGLLGNKVGIDKAKEVFAPIFGVYEMRVGDAHPTSSKIEESVKLARIDTAASYLRQGEQLISNFSESLRIFGWYMFEEHFE